MTALVDAPVPALVRPRRRWPLLAALGVIIVMAGGLIFATRSTGPSLGDKFLYVHGENGTYFAWLSMDGRHDSQINSGGGTSFVGGCVNGHSLSSGDDAGDRSEPCDGRPAYLSDAPTDPQAMATYVKAKSNSDDPALWIKQIYSLDSTSYLVPGARRALFASAKYLAGVVLSYNGPIAPSGQHSISIHATAEQGDDVLFDPVTFDPIEAAPDGTYYDLIMQKVVDHVGDR